MKKPQPISRMIPFVDIHALDLFEIPDGEGISIVPMTGCPVTYPCYFVDRRHFKLHDTVWHPIEFARQMARFGNRYQPENPGPSDVLDFYEVYQIPDRKNTDYGFGPYTQFITRFKREDYVLCYQGMLAPVTELLDLYKFHNRSDRPFQKDMHPLSMGDIIVTHREEKTSAFYVDVEGFPEVAEFLENSLKAQRKKAR